MRGKIFEIIQSIVADYGDQIQNSLIQNPKPNLVLYGPGSSIDSIGLVSIIVNTEQRIEEEFDIPITLADEKAMSLKHSPFRSIESLTEYIFDRLEEHKNGK